MEFIYDRTQSDVEYALNNQNSQEFLKGAYNYTDLNRVESNSITIADRLNLYSYPVKLIDPKTNWTMTDFPNIYDMERIRTNINSIKKAYYSFTNVPNNLNKMTYQKANDIEKLLYEIDILINNMIASFRPCGTFASGGMEGLI